MNRQTFSPKKTVKVDEKKSLGKGLLSFLPPKRGAVTLLFQSSVITSLRKAAF